VLMLLLGCCVSLSQEVERLSEKGELSIIMAKKNILNSSFFDELKFIRPNLQFETIKGGESNGELKLLVNTKIKLQKRGANTESEVYFVLSVENSDKYLSLRVSDFRYKSMPIYGKQGTPSIVTYWNDWYSKNHSSKSDLSYLYTNNTRELVDNLFSIIALLP